MKNRRFDDPDVKAVFDGYPTKLRGRLLKLRQLIFATASETEGVGELIETLKWRQPAYLTENPKGGTTIRIDAAKGQADRFAMFFHCQTSLISTFREMYGDTLSFQGNRAIVFALDDEIPEAAVKHCIALALTYHARRAHR